jgi:hypothetical protein
MMQTCSCLEKQVFRPGRRPAWTRVGAIIQKMSVSKIQVGQVWKKAGSDESFLVTRLYSEALATFAVLRPTGKENAAILRVKVIRKGTGQAIPGFSMAQDSDEF